MDPNANLDEQLQLASKIVEAFDNDRPISPATAARLAGLVIALDEWIASGGFLPSRWQ